MYLKGPSKNKYLFMFKEVNFAIKSGLTVNNQSTFTIMIKFFKQDALIRNILETVDCKISMFQKLQWAKLREEDELLLDLSLPWQWESFPCMTKAVESLLQLIHFPTSEYLPITMLTRYTKE